MDKFTAAVVLGVVSGGRLRGHLQRLGADVRHHRGVQLRPRRHRHVGGVHVLAVPRRVGLADVCPRWWSRSVSPPPCGAADRAVHAGPGGHVGDHETGGLGVVAVFDDRHRQCRAGSRTFRTSLDKFFGNNKVNIGSINVTWHDIITIIVAVLVAIGLRLLLYRTRIGVSMRAVVDDSPLTTLNGIRTTRVHQLSWVLGTMLAAVGGILIAPNAGLDAILLSTLIVNAYAAAIFGRLRSLA